jgi:4-hydroxy-2-oxoheptanedioate aldolase
MKQSLRARLAAGETIAAAWLEFGSADVAEAMVRSGWSTIVVDCEHGCVGVDEAATLIRAIEAAGGDAILRTPSGEEAVLKRALDRGARALMVPMVADADMAARVASYCRYPPMGRRGYAAPIVRASGFGADTDYARRANDDVLVIAQIEHIDAVRDFDAIAATPGVDMAFIGPNDLAGSMGLLERLDHPDLAAAFAEIEAKAAKSGAMLGTIIGQGRGWAELRALGYRLIVGPNDISLLTTAFRKEAGLRDAALGPDPSP